VSDRLERQLAFLLEADKLKAIERRTPLVDNSRQENSAEHSWHLALAAVTLIEYAPEGTDLLHALRLVTVHDVVEIDAGDTFAYDPAQRASKEARELAAAERIFGLLPQDTGAQLREWWNEFEAMQTPPPDLRTRWTGCSRCSSTCTPAGAAGARTASRAARSCTG